MTYKIERLGHRGDGIAAGPVFAPRALPGEVIDGDLDGDRIARPKIMEPSSDRVSPPCAHYKSCGGCALQHASDSFVENWKADVVRQALAAQGMEARIRKFVTSEPNTRRRATLSGRRLKSGPVVGFHAPLSDTVTAIPQCQLLHPDLLAAQDVCRDLVGLLGSRKGELKFRVTLSDAGIDLDVSGGRPVANADFPTLAGSAQTHDLARLSVEGEVIVERRPPVQSFAGIKVTPPPGAFLQATPSEEQALRQAVAEAVGDASKVVDLFAGCGTFSLPLAKNAEVCAVESEQDLLTALDTGWRGAQGLKRVKTEARDLFRRPLLMDELNRFDAVVIDPPRAGAEAQTQELAKSNVSRIAFVSCNPTTFARDAKRLVDAGFSLNWIDVIDQFRWATHVELAAEFTR